MAGFRRGTRARVATNSSAQQYSNLQVSAESKLVTWAPVPCAGPKTPLAAAPCGVTCAARAQCCHNHLPAEVAVGLQPRGQSAAAPPGHAETGCCATAARRIARALRSAAYGTQQTQHGLRAMCVCGTAGACASACRAPVTGPLSTVPAAAQMRRARNKTVAAAEQLAARRHTGVAASAARRRLGQMKRSAAASASTRERSHACGRAPATHQHCVSGDRGAEGGRRTGTPDHHCALPTPAFLLRVLDTSRHCCCPAAHQETRPLVLAVHAMTTRLLSPSGCARTRAR